MRYQEIILPLLRDGLPDTVSVNSWREDIDYRHVPMILIRRIGGVTRSVLRPQDYENPVVEMTAYAGTNLALQQSGLIAVENLYIQARRVLYDAWSHQTVVPDKGHIARYKETSGPSPADSPLVDTWRVRGLLQLGLRPAR